MLDPSDCAEVVSIIRAIVFGADGACVDVGTGSLIGLVAAFIAAVVVLRFAGVFALAGIGALLFHRAKPEAAEDETGYESPIRSTGAWRTKE